MFYPTDPKTCETNLTLMLHSWCLYSYRAVNCQTTLTQLGRLLPVLPELENWLPYQMTFYILNTEQNDMHLNYIKHTIIINALYFLLYIIILQCVMR